LVRVVADHKIYEGNWRSGFHVFSTQKDGEEIDQRASQWNNIGAIMKRGVIFGPIRTDSPNQKNVADEEAGGNENADIEPSVVFFF